MLELPEIMLLEDTQDLALTTGSLLEEKAEDLGALQAGCVIGKHLCEAGCCVNYDFVVVYTLPGASKPHVFKCTWATRIDNGES